MQALKTDTLLINDFHAVGYFLFGSIALLAAGSDVRIIVKGALTGRRRITRHLWRMCFALFIATASFFLGQQDVFPKPLQGTFLLASPVMVLILLSLFWAIRVRFSMLYENW